MYQPLCTYQFNLGPADDLILLFLGKRKKKFYLKSIGKEKILNFYLTLKVNIQYNMRYMRDFLVPLCRFDQNKINSTFPNAKTKTLNLVRGSTRAFDVRTQ